MSTTDSKPVPARPTIVCLCGSMRFGEAFIVANHQESMAGRITLLPVQTIFPDPRSGQEQEAFLGELHCRKIDLADEVLFLNVGGYIGEATCRELAYALRCLTSSYRGKGIRFLDPDKGREFMSENRHRLGVLIRMFGGQNDQYHHWPGTTPSDCGEPGRGVPAPR